MHEYSMVQALLERVQTEVDAHHASSVAKIRMRIGELSGVETDLFATAFELFRERTPCAQADLEIVPVEATWSCPGCGRSIRRGEILRCADCSLPARLVSGDEIVLDRIEMEVPDV